MDLLVGFLTKVATSYQNIGKQSSILASVNKSCQTLRTNMAVEQGVHHCVVRWLGFHGMHSMPSGKPGEKRYVQFKNTKCTLKDCKEKGKN